MDIDTPLYTDNLEAYKGNLALKPSLYTSTDVQEGIFADILTLLPGLKNHFVDCSERSIDGNIINCTRNIELYGSKEFCKIYKEKGIISIGSKGEKGSFSKTGALKVSNSDSLISNISIDSKKKTFNLYFMETIAKQLHDEGGGFGEAKVEIFKDIKKVTQRFDKHENMFTIIMSDPVYETVVGSLISMLFDLGLTPSVPKYLAFYSCYPDDPKSFFIMEKCGYSINDLLYKPEYAKVFNKMTVYDYIMMYFQIAHTFMQMQLTYGIFHFDAHPGNILINVVNQKLDKKTSPLRSMYDGKDLKDAKYYCYNLPITDESDNKSRFYRFFIENNGLLPKLIDYGISIADLSKSTDNKDLRVRFLNRYPIYEESGVRKYNDKGVNTINEKNYHTAFDSMINEGNLPFMYFLNTSVWHLFRVGFFEKRGQTKRAMNLLKDKTFQEFILNVSSNTINIKAILDGDTRTNLYDYFTNKNGEWQSIARYNGNNPSSYSTVISIIDFFVRKNKFSKSGDGKYTDIVIKSDYKHQVNINNIDPDEIVQIGNKKITLEEATRQTKLFEMYKKYTNNCKESQRNNRNIKNSCSKLFRDIDNLKFRSSIFYDFYNNFVILPNDKKINSKDVNDLCMNPENKSTSCKINPNFLITKFIIIPELQGEDIRKFLKYKKRHRLFNYLQPPSKLTENGGKDIENIIADIVLINPNNYRSNLNKFFHTKNGFETDVGYYITDSNINSLTDWITRDDIGKPIGFYYNSKDKENSGTFLPFPFDYKDHLAVLWCDGDNKLHFTKSKHFHNIHSLIEFGDLLFHPSGNNILDVKIGNGVIRMSDNNIPLDKEGNEVKYKSAIEIGPILIWDGEIIFNRELMEDKIFKVNYDYEIENKVYKASSNFKLDKKASNTKRYFNEVGEADALYGQKNSNSLTKHNVLCELNDGNIMIFFIEGKGYNSIGLDRVQLTELINRFDVKNAVCLGGCNKGILRVENKKRSWINSFDPKTMMNEKDIKLCFSSKS